MIRIVLIAGSTGASLSAVHPAVTSHRCLVQQFTEKIDDHGQPSRDRECARDRLCALRSEEVTLSD